MDQHSNRYLLADMLLIGRTLPEILMARGTLIFLLHLGFVINLRKVVLHPVKQIEFMGLVKNTEKMTLALSEKKLKRVSTMSGDFHAAKNFSLKSHRVNWPVVINCPDHFTSTNAVSTGALEHSCSSREQTCSAIFFEDGWYPQSTPFKNQQVNLDLSTISSDHNYCRVPPKQVEYQTRLGVRVQECKTYPIGNYIEKFI